MKVILLIALLFSSSVRADSGCPFQLSSLCFYPAVGFMAAKKTASADYKDLRFAAILHESFDSNNRGGFNFMVAPGEKFIDSAGIGYSYAVFQVEDGGWAVVNFGGLAKRYSATEDVRGGLYFMLTYSPKIKGTGSTDQPKSPEQ